MLSTDYESLGFFARGYVHATNTERAAAACGILVKRRKVQVTSDAFRANCPLCCSKLSKMRGEEEARGLHRVIPKQPFQHRALVIFKLRQVLFPSVIDDEAVGVVKGTYGTEESVFSALRSFEKTLSKSDLKRPNTGVIAARFLAFVLSNPEDDEPANIEWSFCKSFQSWGANPYDTTWWLIFDRDGEKQPEYMVQKSSKY